MNDEELDKYDHDWRWILIIGLTIIAIISFIGIITMK